MVIFYLLIGVNDLVVVNFKREVNVVYVDILVKLGYIWLIKWLF